MISSIPLGIAGRRIVFVCNEENVSSNGNIAKIAFYIYYDLLKVCQKPPSLLRVFERKMLFDDEKVPSSCENFASILQ